MYCFVRIFILTDGAAETIKYDTIRLRQYRYNIIKVRKKEHAKTVKHRQYN